MSYQIIGVHGLSSKPDPEILASGWRKAICEGIQDLRDETAANPEIEFEMVDWIDLYQVSRDNSDQYKPAEQGKIKRYQEGWLDSFRGTVGDAVDDPLLWLKRRSLATDVAEKALDYIQDLDKYYENATLRAQTRQLLIDVIKQNSDKRILLIGHSMGSIISYDVLRILDQENPEIRIAHYITIGSPLGLPQVQLRFVEEFGNLLAPENITVWNNFADKRDPVALDTHLKGDFQPNSNGVRPEDDLVINDWGDINHKSYGYLRCPEVAEKIENFIKS